MTVGAYQDAEDAMKQAGTVWQPRGRRLRPFYRDQTKVHLAVILNAQGRGDEAAKVLEAFLLLRNPNSKEPFWLLKEFPKNRNPEARRTLARSLLQNDRLDEILKLDLEADARDVLEIYASDQYSVTTILQILAELGFALLTKIGSTMPQRFSDEDTSSGWISPVAEVAVLAVLCWIWLRPCRKGAVKRWMKQ